MELTTTMGKLTGDAQKDMKMLMNFVFNQTEEMRYLMHNLDVTNFNDLGLARYENGRMQIYTEKLNVATKELTLAVEAVDKRVSTLITVDLEGIKATVKNQNQNLNAALGGVGQIQEKFLPEIRATITQHANKISLVVEETDGANVIKTAAITAAINGSDSEVFINADKIKMTGTTTFLSAADVGADGSTVIDGGRIKSGEIVGITLISESGTKKVTIADGAIAFNNGGLIQNNRNGDLVIESQGDMLIGSTDSRFGVSITSMGYTWALTADGWVRQ